VNETPATRWRTRDVWLITLSAGFADLGYQAIVAGVPLLLVLQLHASAAAYGLAAGLGYGLGSVTSILGGRLGDRFGRKPVAVAGNLGILLLSAISLARSVPTVIILFVLGWLARNFRSPVRRAMLVEVVSRERRRDAFGLLHAIDVGGGLLSAVAAVVLVGSGLLSLRMLFAITAIPIATSSLLLALVRSGRVRSSRDEPSASSVDEQPAQAAATRRVRRAVLLATALYGFSSYSLGFPVLAIATHAHLVASGFGAYAVFLGVSAVTGYLVGRWRGSPLWWLALGGYGLSAVGSTLLVPHGLAVSFLGVGLLGVGLGVIETLEPTLIARLAPDAAQGRAMGGLTAARSLGLLLADLLLGALFASHGTVAFLYGAVLAAVAAVVIAAQAPQVRHGAVDLG